MMIALWIGIPAFLLLLRAALDNRKKAETAKQSSLPSPAKLKFENALPMLRGHLTGQQLDRFLASPAGTHQFALLVDELVDAANSGSPFLKVSDNNIAITDEGHGLLKLIDLSEELGDTGICILIPPQDLAIARLLKLVRAAHVDRS